MRGPTPKRSDQRRRMNKPEIPIDTAPAAAKVAPPDADPEWHPVARRWYDALSVSGQATWYEPSDWATAYLVAENLSRDLSPQYVGVSIETGETLLAQRPISGSSLSAYLKAMTALLVTEGDRRRSRIELSRQAAGAPADTPGVPNLADYRDRLAT